MHLHLIRLEGVFVVVVVTLEAVVIVAVVVVVVVGIVVVVVIVAAANLAIRRRLIRVHPWRDPTAVGRWKPCPMPLPLQKATINRLGGDQV